MILQPVPHPRVTSVCHAEDAAMDKKRIASSYSAAAVTYDALASLQKDVGHQLLHGLETDAARLAVADLGCGTGWLTQTLRCRYPNAYLLGADLAKGMIQYARTHHTDLANDWWVADMESLPLADQSFDLLYSNLAMQWLKDPLPWFLEAFRVLKPGGRLLCSTLLPGTLYELARAWDVADQKSPKVTIHSHVNSFVPKDGLLLAFQHAGFTGRLHHYQDIRYHDSVRRMMTELKGIGAHNVTSGRSHTMTSKGSIRLMLEHYESFRTQKGYPSTYEVALLSLCKPE